MVTEGLFEFESGIFIVKLIKLFNSPTFLSLPFSILYFFLIIMVVETKYIFKKFDLFLSIFQAIYFLMFYHLIKNVVFKLQY